jgi:inosine-uridine nucleoside N-ribohydrolase
LVGQYHRAEAVHGKNGLADIELPKASAGEEAMNAPQAIYEFCRTDPGLTLVTLGPMTNAAMAVNLYPELKELIGEIVSMGGAIKEGNITRFAEFNYFADPEAVQFILDSGIALTVVPWDAAVGILHTEADLQALDFGENKAADLFFRLQAVPLDFFERTKGQRASALPDPIAMAYVVDPRIARRLNNGNLRMELDSGAVRGASIPVEGQRLSSVHEIDKAGFDTLLLRIATL